MSYDIIDTFDRARDEAAFKAFDHERLVHNLSQADGIGELNNAGVIDGAAGMVRELRIAEQEAERRNKDNVETQVLLASMRLSNFESGLEAQYGENFASNMFADLYEDGLIEEDDYKRIMAIEDKDERRKAIASHIQKGLDDGTIKMEDLKDHPWAKEWLDLHKEAIQERNAEADMVLQSNELSNDVSDAAANRAAELVKSESLSQELLDNDNKAGASNNATSAGFSFGIPS